MIPSLLALLLLVLLGIAGLGIGLILLRGLGIVPTAANRDTLLEHSIFAIAPGLGVIAYLVLLLGLLHLASPLPLSLLLGAVIVIGGIGIYSNRAHFSKIGFGFVPTQPLIQTPFRIVCVVIFTILGVATLIGALAPPVFTEWDALSYHLAGPKTYLRAGHIFYIPYDHHTNFPFTWQMLYLLMLGLGSIGGAKLCHWLCGVLLVVSVYTFATRYVKPLGRGRLVGLLAALILATTPIVLWEASVAYVDLATALLTWLSLYALLNATLPTESVPHPGRGWLLLSAVLMGLALGTKLTVLGFWGLMLIGLVGGHYLQTRRLSMGMIRDATLWGGVALVIAAPWFIKSVLYTGNPVYPFFYNLFGGRYWSAENAALYAADQARFGYGKAPINLLLSLWQVTMPDTASKFTEYDFALSPVYLAILLAAPLMVRRLSRPAGILLAFGIGVYVFWFFLMQQTRYLIPALPAFALVAAEVLTAEANTLKIRFPRRIAFALIAVSALWGVYIATIRIAYLAFPVVSGQITANDYVARRLPGLGRAEQFINTNTPPDVKVALFDEVRGFYLDRDYAWATPNHAAGFFAWDTYKDADAWCADFKQRGYTILLVNTPAGPPANDRQRWRVLLPEAVAAGKVRLLFEQPTPLGVTQVYQIL